MIPRDYSGSGVVDRDEHKRIVKVSCAHPALTSHSSACQDATQVMEMERNICGSSNGSSLKLRQQLTTTMVWSWIKGANGCSQGPREVRNAKPTPKRASE